MFNENATYHPDAVDAIVKLLKDTYKSKFKAYLDGDPDAIGESMLPCIMVTQPDGDITDGATGTDDVAETVIIRVVCNKKDDLNASPDVDLTERKLRKFIIGQVPGTKEWMPGTLMHTLRVNYTLGDVAVGNRISFNIIDVLRPDEVITKEGVITVEIERMAIVPVRT